MKFILGFLISWVIILGTVNILAYKHQEHQEQPDTVVYIAFNDSKQPLGWGTDDIVIHTPGYVYEIAKYDCSKGHTIQVMVPNNFHVVCGETIEVTK